MYIGRNTEILEENWGDISSTAKRAASFPSLLRKSLIPFENPPRYGGGERFAVMDHSTPVVKILTDPVSGRLPVEYVSYPNILRNAVGKWGEKNLLNGVWHLYSHGQVMAMVPEVRSTVFRVPRSYEEPTTMKRALVFASALDYEATELCLKDPKTALQVLGEETARGHYFAKYRDEVLAILDEALVRLAEMGIPFEFPSGNGKHNGNGNGNGKEGGRILHTVPLLTN